MVNKTKNMISILEEKNASIYDVGVVGGIFLIDGILRSGSSY